MKSQQGKDGAHFIPYFKARGFHAPISMIVDVVALQRLVDEGYLTSRPHPTADLLIWNYTAKAQYEQYWTPEIMMCRGLITTSDGSVVSRPFKKFMNIEQHQGPLPLEPFKVTEKMDGSLGISYIIDGKVAIATRGSFTSEQAIHATELLYKRYEAFLPMMLQTFQYTYLFEIVYPQNQIVVSYGEMDDLVLLAIIETDTGKEIDIHDSTWVNLWPFPIVKHHDGITDIAILKTLEEANREGFVIRFESGLRVKAKMAEYIRLHKILTGINAKVIWELMRNNQSFDDILTHVPDEFYAWVGSTRDSLLNGYAAIEEASRQLWEQVKDLPSRKEQAIAIGKNRYSAIVFRMLDGKDYSEIIWKMVKPQAEKPFREEVEN